MAGGNLDPSGFAVQVLRGVGAPITHQNVASIVGWAKAEGGHWSNGARYNPLNTTQGAPGATSINSVGVKAYQNWQQGLAATVQTLRNGHYGNIIAGLHASNPGSVAAAIGSSPWGTSGSVVSQTIRNALGGKYNLNAAPTPTLTTPRAGGSPQYAVQNTQSFDQKGYDQAQRSYKLGSFLNAQGSNPLGSLGDAKGVSAGIKGLSSGGNTLFQTGLATLTAPKASDYVTAQSKLQEIAGTKLAVHPGAQAGGFGKIQLAGQAVQDAKSAGANPAAQKLLRMLHFVQGAPYSQPNHDAVNQNEFTVKARGTDCSGLISWLMGPQGLGIWRASQTTPTIPGAPGLQSGQGRVVTVWNNNQPGNSGHVFIKVGNTYFASEGGVGVHQLPASEVQGYLTQGSDGGHYQAFHPKGL